MLFVMFWHVQYTWTKEEHVTISISILKHYSLGTLTIVMILTPKCWEKLEHLKTNLSDFRAWSAIFHLSVLLSSYQCQNLNVYCMWFCFVIITCVYFVRRGVHISQHRLLSNPIGYVQYNIIKLNEIRYLRLY
jgi:hypothetical protein